MTTTARDAFIDHFGPDLTARLEQAAHAHTNESQYYMPRRGSDPFRWALVVVIGWGCTTHYRAAHQLSELDPEEFAAWCRAHGGLDEYDGDFDSLTTVDRIYAHYVRRTNA